MSIAAVDNFEVKHSQRHLLAAFENNRLGAAIGRKSSEKGMVISLGLMNGLPKDKKN